MVNDWEEIKLDSLVDFTPKRTIKKGTLAPFVSMADITENSKYIPEFFEKEYKGGGSRFKNGDTLFARITPCLQNGKCSRVTGLKDDSIAHGSTEFIVMAAKNPEFDSEFIYYLARTPHFRAYAESRMIGSTGRQRVAWQDLADYEFIVPNEPQRKLIGDVLSKFDEKIELNRQMNETLEAMAQALFKSWFVDFDPVIDNALLAGKTIPEPLKERADMHQAQLDSGKVKTNSEINDLFPSEFEFTEELGWIPMGWSVKSFSHLAKLDTTSVKPSLEPEKIWEHYSIPAFDVDESPVFDLGETIKSNKYKVDSNAILVSKLNPETERIWWVDIDDEDSAICSTEFMQFIPENVGHRGYIYNLVRSYPFQVEILSRVTGSTGSRQRAQPKSVAEIAVILPNSKLVDRFSEISGNLKSKVSSNIRQNTQLAKLRDTLLPKLMSGELRIVDAEKLAENI